MQACVNIDGVIMPADRATISIFDHGFLFGDSIYEAFRTYRGKLFLFSRHFERLSRGARGIYLTLPWTKDQIREEIVRTIGAAANPGESRIRLIVTRGIGGLLADPETCSDPRVIIIVTPLPDCPDRFYSEGVEMIISSVPRGGLAAEHKTGNLMHQVLAARETKARGAYDAILLTTDGYISDGIASNVYLVQESLLKTPGSTASIIEGITRGAVLELARELGMKVVEGLFPPAEIERSSEMFFSSSNREVVPIVRVDGKPVGNGRPGPWTVKILAAYRNAVERLLLED